MIQIENANLFGKAAANALATVDSNDNLKSWEKLRYLNGISKAVAQIEQNGAWMEFDADKKEMVIWSQGSNEVYTANGSCQCKAFEHSQICWHRCAARLWQRYLELIEREETAAVAVSPYRECDDEYLRPPAASAAPQTLREILDEQNSAPYLKATSTKAVERVGNYRI